MKILSIVLPTALALVVSAANLPAAAQLPDPDRAPFIACSTATSGGAAHGGEARSLGAESEAFYRRLVAERRRDPAPRVLLARVLMQCRLPFAEMMAQASLVGQANELLAEALELDSHHWEARFTLAMSHFNSPAFLGRTPDAERELQILLEQQGDRTDDPAFAETYLYLGEVQSRRGRADDAAATWRRGAALFPLHEGLRARAEGQTGGTAVDRASASGSGPRPVVELQAIVVAASGTRMDDPHSGVALQRLDVLTTPGGAADLMQALRTTPGTSAATEGSDLYVRGGDPAEAPVWIDGARIFYPGRYESLNGSVFGILDPAVLRNAFFSSGGFSARYGNALSGVLDVETEGLPASRSGHLAMNTVQLGATVRAPIGTTAGVWGGARAMNGTALLAMHGRGDEFAVAPRALEGMGAFVWEPRPGTELKATAFVDGDRSAREVDAYGYRGVFDSRGANRLFGLSARLLSRDGRAGIRANLSLSTRKSAYEFGVLDQERTDRSASSSLSGELDLGRGTRLRAGGELTGLRAEYGGMYPADDQLSPGSAAREATSVERAAHGGGYVEVEGSPHGRLVLIGGLRADRLPGEARWTADPRFALALRASDEWTLRLGGGVFHQGRWRTRYTVPNSDSPSGTPRSAVHVIAGAERRGEPSIRLEGYLKEYGDYVDAGDGPEIASGRAIGGDAIVRWSEQGRLNGWITYSLLRGRVRLADGATVPSAVDVTHSLTAVTKLEVADGWQLGTTGRIATGRPYSVRGGEPHGGRLPTYHRIDMRVTRFGSLGSRTLVSYLELLNVLDRENISAYTFDSDGERRAVPAFFRRTAVVGFSLSF